MIICIPAHNEQHNIGALVHTCEALYPEHEVLVVDDGSTDFTAAAATNAGATVISNRKGSQYGDGFLTGCIYALQKQQHIVFMDAGFSYWPTDLQRFLDGIQGTDVVLGIRWQKGRIITRLGRWFLSRVTGFLGADYASMRAMSVDALPFVIGMAAQCDKRAHLFNPQLAYKLWTSSLLKARRLVSYHPTNTTLRPWGVIGIAIAFVIFWFKERRTH